MEHSMRYYLDIRHAESLSSDPEGTEFQTLEDACAEAVLAAREMMAEDLVAGRPLGGRTFEIRQEGRGIVATVPFEQAIPVA